MISLTCGEKDKANEQAWQNKWTHRYREQRSSWQRGGEGKGERRVRGVKMQTALWYMHNGILHSHRKGHIWVSPNEVDEPRACYTEWRGQKEKNKYILMHILEKDMVTHSSILAQGIPRTEEPGELQSMESQRVRHDWLPLSFNACTWHLESRYWWAYLQGSDGDADTENRLVDTVREGEGPELRE